MFDIDGESTFQRLPYDYMSIMHYNAMQFSRNGFYTLDSRNASISPALFGGSKSPSELDYMHINLLYCHGKFTP